MVGIVKQSKSFLYINFGNPKIRYQPKKFQKKKNISFPLYFLSKGGPPVNSGGARKPTGPKITEH